MENCVNLDPETAANVVARDISLSTSRPKVPVLLFSVAAAIIITPIFAPQTLVKLMAASFGLSTAVSGFVPMIPLIGYALGLFFIVPLADLVENRRLVLQMLVAASLSSLGIVLFSSVPLLFLLLLISGAACSVIQVLVPTAAAMAAPEERGRIIGDIMSGLMVGILLSRPLGSLLASFGSWTAFYVSISIALALLAVALRLRLPQHRVGSSATYPGLIGSLWHLFWKEPVLRKQSITAAIVMSAFNIYWTSVVYVLTGPKFNLGPKGVALFALAGAGGAIVTPLVGRLADKGLGKKVTFVANIVLILGFGVAAFGGLSLTAPWVLCLIALALGAVLLDVGVLGVQTIGRILINQMNPAARGRINGVFVGVFFIGGAIGSAAAGMLWAWHGWAGICVGGAIIGLINSAVDRALP